MKASTNTAIDAKNPTSNEKWQIGQKGSRAKNEQHGIGVHTSARFVYRTYPVDTKVSDAQQT
jgi:hypothetical protein